MRVSVAGLLMATAGSTLGQNSDAAKPAAEPPPATTPAATPTTQPKPVNDAAPVQNDTKNVFGLTAVPPKWTIQVEPMAWYAGPAGDLRLPGVRGGSGSDKIQLSDVNLDTSRLSPAGEIHINADRWQFSFSGAGYSADIETTANGAFTIGSVAVADNDALRAKYDWTTVQLTAGYLVWSYDFAGASEKPENAVPALLRIYGFGGGRLHDIDISISSLVPARAGTTGTDQFYGELIVGARAELELADDFTIDLELSGGGMGDSGRTIASFDIIAGFQWRPVENVGLQIGWRQLAYWLSDGEGSQEFELNGETAGVYAGLTIRF